MPHFGPLSRRELISGLREFGFTGPIAGGNHEYTVKGTLRLTIPNPHHSVIGRDLLARILRQAGVTREEWEASA